jgi:nucleoside-triphosphatase
MNLVVTGDIGVGKTTACENLVEAIRSRGLSCGGVLQPAIMENEVKVGSNIVNLTDGSSTVFARLKKTAPFGGVEVGKYMISNEGIAFAVSAINSALTSDVLFIDEIGPLELSLRGGFMGVLMKVVSVDGIHVVVVRKKLVSSFRGLFPELDFKVFEVNLENRNSISKKIINVIEQDGTRGI